MILPILKMKAVACPSYVRYAHSTRTRETQFTERRLRQLRFEHSPGRDKRTKNKKTQFVRVDKSLIERIQREHKPVEGSSWIFAHRGGEKAGQRIASLKKGIQAAAEKAGLEGVSAHVFRHSVASYLGATGAPSTVIRDHLRHGDLKTSNIYAHSEAEAKIEAGKVLAGALSEGTSCPKSCPSSLIDEAFHRLQKRQAFKKAIKTVENEMRSVERETGLEPATLSLGS